MIGRIHRHWSTARSVALAILLLVQSMMAMLPLPDAAMAMADGATTAAPHARPHVAQHRGGGADAQALDDRGTDRDPGGDLALLQVHAADRALARPVLLDVRVHRATEDGGGGLRWRSGAPRRGCGGGLGPGAGAGAGGQRSKQECGKQPRRQAPRGEKMDDRHGGSR